jgi:hypothetical protein
MDVQRYAPEVCGDLVPAMEEHHSGDYVKYEDYEELHDQLVDTQVELKILRGKITDLFMEM